LSFGVSLSFAHAKISEYEISFETSSKVPKVIFDKVGAWFKVAFKTSRSI